MSIDGVDLMDHSIFQGRSYFEWRKYDPKYAAEFEVPDDIKGSLCKAFTLMDDNGDGVLELKELAELLAALGRSNLGEDLKQLEPYTDARGDEGARGMNFHQFQKFMIQQLVKASESELREAFQIFDTQPLTGKLDLVKLRACLKNQGLKLTDDEIDFLFREEDYWRVEDKKSFDYEDLISKILGKPFTNAFLYNWE